MIAGCCFPIFVLLSPKINHSVPLVVFSFVIAALLIWTHRKNIDRLKKRHRVENLHLAPRRFQKAQRPR